MASGIKRGLDGCKTSEEIDTDRFVYLSNPAALLDKFYFFLRSFDDA